MDEATRHEEREWIAALRGVLGGDQLVLWAEPADPTAPTPAMDSGANPEDVVTKVQASMLLRDIRCFLAQLAVDDLHPRTTMMRVLDEPELLAVDLVDDDARPPPPTVVLIADSVARHGPPQRAQVERAHVDVREATAA
jgi:hypothetical protein